MAVERYLLRELSSEEIEAFEDHYFDCRDCTQAVLDGTLVLDGGRSLVRQEQRQRQPGARRRWMPLAAAGLFGAVALYTAPMAMRVPALTAQVNAYTASAAKADNDVLSLITDASANRAEADGLRTLPAHAYNTWSLQLFQTNPSFVGYEAEVVDAVGKSKGRVPLSLERLTHLVLLEIRPLSAGQYSLVVEGISSDGTRTQLQKTPFVVQ